MRSITPENCLWARQQISLHLDSELSPFEEFLLEAHVAGCDACRAHAAELERLTGLLRATPVEEPPVSFRLPRRRGGRIYALSAISAAATVAVVALSGLMSLHVPPVRTTADEMRTARERITLKEELLDRLDSVRPTSAQRIPLGLKAAEQTSLVTAKRSILTRSRPEDQRFPQGVSGTSEGGRRLVD
jgi:anti-sigma factor RsiW